MGMQVIWNGVVLAESDETEVVEGNHYFPPSSINREYFRKSKSHTVCPWKGVASYYDIEVDGQVRKAGAWYYPDPSPAAQHIEGHVAFYKGRGVKVVRSSSEGSADGESVFKRLVNAVVGK